MISALVVALLLSAQRLSASEEIDSRCGGSTPEVQICAAGVLDREDARLNRAYKAAMARLKPARQASLRAEQRQWIKDRDTECDAEYEQGGTQAGIQATACRAFLTQTRADELERLGRPSR